MGQFNTRSLIGAITGLAGIWLLLRQLPSYASSVFATLSGVEGVSSDLLVIHGIHFAVSAVLGLTLVILRGKLAAWLVPEESTNSLEVSSFLAIGAAIIGVYFTAQGVITLGESYTVYRIPDTSNPYLFWNGVFSVAVGLALFLGSFGIGRMWELITKLRRVGV
ncbi:hypothetical protein [Marinobacter alkaliphilus]|uniref:hypothetical protein n=1 Tax=Marinobacter alkaliphilus TaxID=254719 RepID=UPI003D80C42F|nr:hypothetical protein PBN92_11670 [Marinobacter alkaliphilus]